LKSCAKTVAPDAVTRRYSISATPPLTASAAKPTAPIVSASGGTPERTLQSAFPSTKTPKAPMHAALKRAALARVVSVMPSTARLIA
jgi:hypothetical protein